MSRRGKYSKPREFNKHQLVLPSAADTELLSMKDPVMLMFQDIAKRLTDRHDRHERIFKLARDVTIESKRIIFLLHAPPVKEKPKEMIIEEAKARLTDLINGPIKSIALEEPPPYMHLKAYSGGMQEFVEAQTFCSYVEKGEIMDLAEIQDRLTYTTRNDDGTEKTVQTLLVLEDYMLGIADLTGEVMRKTIYGAARRDGNEILFACDLLRRLYAGFISLYGARFLNFKMKMIRANLLKVEKAVLAYILRGHEALQLLDLQDKQPDTGCDPLHDDHLL